MHRRSLLAAMAALPATAHAQGQAQAQAFPARPIRIIVPFAPGGSGDITARLVAQHIERATGQSVVTDNRPGANGIIGTMAVKVAAPDGYTAMLATTSTHNANPFLVKDLPYDPVRDFAVVSSFGSAGGYLLVPANSPWQSLPQLVAAAKAAPGQVFFGHFNATSLVPGLLLNAMAGIEMQPVPYRTIGAAFTDMLGGRVQVIFVDPAAADAFLKAGQVRALAHTRAGTWAARPGLPAVESLYPGFVFSGFLGLAVPAATPPAVQQRLNALCNDALMSEPMHGRLLEFGFTPGRVSLADCEALMREERDRWRRVTQVAGVVPE
jgi:tripartite-type tricarboxylate transporter receptor subunit TctC